MQSADQAVQGPEESPAGGIPKVWAQDNTQVPEGWADTQTGHTCWTVWAKHQWDDGFTGGKQQLDVLISVVFI